MSKARKIAPVRVFRPTAPTFRQTRGALFFALLSLLGLVGWMRKGDPTPLLVGLGFTIAASWLAYRGRIFGDPTLIAEPERIVFRKSGREVAALWRDIERVSFGPYRRGEIWLVRRDGAPIRINSSMTSAEGERFDMVFEDYLPSDS